MRLKEKLKKVDNTLNELPNAEIRSEILSEDAMQHNVIKRALEKEILEKNNQGVDWGLYRIIDLLERLNAGVNFASGETMALIATIGERLGAVSAFVLYKSNRTEMLVGMIESALKGSITDKYLTTRLLDNILSAVFAITSLPKEGMAMAISGIYSGATGKSNLIEITNLENDKNQINLLLNSLQNKSLQDVQKEIKDRLDSIAAQLSDPQNDIPRLSSEKADLEKKSELLEAAIQKSASSIGSLLPSREQSENDIINRVRGNLEDKKLSIEKTIIKAKIFKNSKELNDNTLALKDSVSDGDKFRLSDVNKARIAAI